MLPSPNRNPSQIQDIPMIKFVTVCLISLTLMLLSCSESSRRPLFKVSEKVARKDAWSIIKSALSHNDSVIRTQAVDALARTKDPGVIKLLDFVYDNQNVPVQKRIIDIAAQYQDSFAVSIVKKALRTPDLEIWKYALKSAAKIGDPAFVPILEKVYQNVDSIQIDEYAMQANVIEQEKMEFRILLAIALWKLGKGTHESLVRKGLTESTYRRTTTRAIGEMRLSTLLPELENRFAIAEIEEKIQILDAIDKIGSKSALTFLQSLLRASEPRVRVNAAAALLDHQVLVNEENLLAGLASSNGDDIVRINQAINQLNDSAFSVKALPLIRANARSIEPWIKLSSLAALIDLKDAASIDLIEGSLDHRSDDVKSVAISGLARFQGETANERLKKILEGDGVWFVKASAIKALAEINGKKELSYLYSYLRDQDPLVAIHAAAVILRTTGRDAG